MFGWFLALGLPHSFDIYIYRVPIYIYIYTHTIVIDILNQSFNLTEVSCACLSHDEFSPPGFFLCLWNRQSSRFGSELYQARVRNVHISASSLQALGKNCSEPFVVVTLVVTLPYEYCKSIVLFWDVLSICLLLHYF